MLALASGWEYRLPVSDKALSAWAAAMARRKAAKMSKAERSEHARKMALARWGKAKGAK